MSCRLALQYGLFWRSRLTLDLRQLLPCAHLLQHNITDSLIHFKGIITHSAIHCIDLLRPWPQLINTSASECTRYITNLTLGILDQAIDMADIAISTLQ